MLKAGIIGLGVGEAHIAGYEEHPDCKVVALCDFDDEKAKMAKEKYPEKKFYKKASDLLDDPGIDVVTIASYDTYHFEQIKQALENDKHIFVEKPFVIYEDEAQQVRELLTEKPHLQLSSNLILRTSPRFIELREWIRSGKMGTPYYVEADYQYGRMWKLTEGWRGEIPYYSVIYGGGVHMVDLLLWLTGDRVAEVSSFGNKISTEGTQFKYNDLTVSILQFESGMTAKVACNFSSMYPHFHKLEVYGTKATFMNRLGTGLLYKDRDNGAPPEEIETPYRYKAKGAMLPNFIRSIIDGEELMVGKKDVFDAMSVCFAMEKAVQSNNKVQVTYY